MTTIGYATLQIIPSLRGVSAAIDKELRNQSSVVKVGADEQAARRSGQRAGRQLSDAVERETRGLGKKIGDAFDPSLQMPKVGRLAATALKGAMLGGVAGIGAVIAGTIGGALFKGFERLKSIDDARFKLEALGHSAAETQSIMDSALASVKGTAFSFGEAATAAATAVAAGIKPGKDLTTYLKDVADASAVAGTSLADMGDVFNNIQTIGAAYNDNLQILAQRGLPVYSWLSESLHMSTADVKQFASEGKISAAQFQEAIEKHIGGAALTMGQSFSGSVQNAEAALARLGAAFLQPAFVNAAGGFGSITSGLDDLTAWIGAHQDDLISFWENLGTGAVRAVQNLGRGVGGILQAVGDIVGGIGNIEGTVLKFEAWQADIRGDHETASQLRDQAQAAFGWGESIRAAGDKLANLSLDSTTAKIHGWADAARDAAAQSQNAAGRVASFGDALGALPFKKTISVDADTGPADVKMQSWFDKWKSIIAAPPTPTPAPPIIPSLTDPNRPRLGGGRAFGGPIFGAGGPKSDIIPIWASNGEHMLPADEVDMMGGQSGVYQFRKMLRAGMFAGGGALDNLKLGALIWPPEPVGPSDKTRPGGVPDLRPGRSRNQIGLPDWGTPGQAFGPPPPGWFDKPVNPEDVLFPDYQPPWIQDWMKKHGKRIKPLGFAGGGAIGPDVQAAGELVGTPYSQANRTDCSGMVARVIDRTLGLPEAGLMSTKNAAEWLAAHGFKKGIGGPGTISVGWYDHGPNPNDGHMAMTLSDGSNAEAGGGVGDIFQIGGGAAGASDPQFDQHMFLPTVFGEGPAGAGTASPFAGGSAVAAMTGAGTATPTSVSGGGTSASSSGGGGGSFSLPSSISDLAGFGLANLGKGVGTTKSGSDLSLFGEAAGAAVSGQVDSALGVLGVNGSPGWLKAISTLVGGISIGGGGSAAPLSATSTGMGTPPPDDAGNMHGTRAGQQPGPVYNITARDTEDAFIKAQRLEREKAAAKLSRF